MSTTLSKFYRVRNEKPVTLTIKIGHGQRGTTSVNLNDEQLVNNHRNTLKQRIGTGEELNGKTLYCSTIVADIRTETNETSITYELRGGVSQFKQTLQESVESEGDVVFYLATFRFYG
ncbi:MAG: hypothetical protein ACE5JP_02430 [Candidatus Bipolaricaulia bacterium]